MLAVALVVAQLADLGTHLLMVGNLGLAAEANPLVRLLAPSPDHALAVKVALIGFVLLVARIVQDPDVPSRHGRLVGDLVLTAGVVVGIGGAFSNLRTVAGG